VGSLDGGGTKPGPGGWNRIHFIVDDLSAEVTRLRDAGARFRNDIIEGPGGKQILLQDPSGNVIELFQPGPVVNRAARLRTSPRRQGSAQRIDGHDVGQG